eukprot:g18450.t1
MPARSFSPPERTAARAILTRNFEGILHDQNRFSYFLDYLSVHSQAHKLLFWFEIEQYKLLAGDDREMASHQETIFGKYFAAGARGGGAGLELPPYAAEHTEMLYNKARGRPLGYMFDVAQAFVYQELRDRWLPQFRSSSSHTALVDHLRMSYPVSLSQLLTEGPFNDCLNSFIYDSGECKADLREDFQVWFAIHSALLPLCASALQTLEKRGVAGSAKELSNLEKEGMKFRDAYLEGPEVKSSPLDKTVKALLVKRIFGLIACKPGAPGVSGVSYAESLRAAVAGLNDALLLGQEQVYRPLEEAVVPALVKSSTFGNFVDDLSSLECAPLQARLRLLNDWADVQRKLPEKAVESTAGGKTSHLLRPCPTPIAPDIWPVASSKAGGVFGGPGRRREGRGRGVRAGDGADVTCPSLLFVFQVDTEETTDLIDTEPGAESLGAPAGGRLGGLGGQAPQGLHGCAAVATASPPPVASPKEGAKGPRGSVRSPPTPSRAPRAYGSPPEDKASSGKSKKKRGSLSPAVRGSNDNREDGGGRMLRRFRTKVRQMRHVIAARVLQDTAPSRRGGGGKPSTPGSDSPWAWDVGGNGGELEDLDLLAGMASNDTDYRQVRSRLNGQILELMSADVTECLPRYCLPSVIARVEAKKPSDKKREIVPDHISISTTTSSSSSSSSPSPFSSSSSATLEASTIPLSGVDGEGGPAAQPPRVHHFVMTVPRKGGSPSPPGSPRAAGSPSLAGGRGGGEVEGEGEGEDAGARGRRGERQGRGSTGGGRTGGRSRDLNRQESDRRWATAKAVKGAFPVAIDRESNIVLHGACSTVWRRVDEPPTPGNGEEGGLTGAEAAAAAATAYVPRCVCALSFDPLFDTLRAVALARGGFPEAGRTLMVGGGGSIEGGGGGGGAPAGSAEAAPAAAGSGARAPWNDDGSSGGLGAARGAGGGGGGGGVHRAEEAFKKTGLLEWGLGDAATLKAGRPPLPILPPPPPKKGPTLPTVFAPSVSREAPTGSASAPAGGRPNPLVQSVSAPDSMGGWSSVGDGGWSTEGWSTEEEASGRGQPREGEEMSGGVAPGGGGWSSFGLPPLVPLDHPVEPLFQALSSDNVLLALSALMCERPVLVTCSVRSLSSVAVSSLKALLHPLGWHHAYAPLLPAAELVTFWRSKVALDKKTALSHGRSGSPPRIAPGSLGGRGGGGGGGEGGRGSPSASPPPRPRPQTPFLVGLDAELVRMATGRGNSGGRGAGARQTAAGPGNGEVWGVASSESCMVPIGAEVGSLGVATTQPSSTMLEVVRRMLKQSVHVDLDHDEVTWPPPPAPVTSPGGKGGGHMTKSDSLGFGMEAGAGAGARAGGGRGGGAPPAWPEEAARQARRVVQSTLFPEFESFDGVSETPPETVHVDFDDDAALFKCSGLSGGGAEASLRDKLEASRSSASALTPPREGSVGGTATGAGTTLTESVVGMYIPTPADLALRAAAAGLVASVLGRVKEFTTLFAQAGLMRFDTAGFVAAVASCNSRKLAAGSKPSGNPNFLSGGGAAASARGFAGSPYPGGSDGGGLPGGGGRNTSGGSGSATAEDEPAPVVVGAAGDDGSSAGGAGEGGHSWGVPGTELCLELVRTRAFAALLSDEVFADVDLETVQEELRLHSRQIRKSTPS